MTNITTQPTTQPENDLVSITSVRLDDGGWRVLFAPSIAAADAARRVLCDTGAIPPGPWHSLDYAPRVPSARELRNQEESAREREHSSWMSGATYGSP